MLLSLIAHAAELEHIRLRRCLSVCVYVCSSLCAYVCVYASK